MQTSSNGVQARDDTTVQQSAIKPVRSSVIGSQAQSNFDRDPVMASRALTNAQVFDTLAGMSDAQRGHFVDRLARDLTAPTFGAYDTSSTTRLIGLAMASRQLGLQGDRTLASAVAHPGQAPKNDQRTRMQRVLDNRTDGVKSFAETRNERVAATLTAIATAHAPDRHAANLDLGGYAARPASTFPAADAAAYAPLIDEISNAKGSHTPFGHMKLAPEVLAGMPPETQHALRQTGVLSSMTSFAQKLLPSF